MNLSVAICDDEPIHRNLLLNYLNQVFHNESYEVLEFEKGEELLENYPEKLDILLLDIQMGGLNGIETAKKIRQFDTNVIIIFTTAVFDFIQQGYEVRAFRYLLKPISYDEFSIHLIECKNDITNEIKKNIKIKETTEGSISIIPISSILYIETVSRVTLIHTDKKIYKTRESIKNLENELENHLFYRCHRSYLINLHKVSSINKDSVYIKNDEILVSRYKIKDLKLRITNTLGSLL
ncbi:MAG: response regulator transcription factor [Paraclostridium bifermentans]|uniref:LytR/AlgR family response regulator transcription factor n=1 Tax=Paraclostridium bifermentans TaxID=1490 RepID=UPI001D328369|nr:LytTR family DNA-binding domain-containing protein [Paraclostridium bifermentans]MBS6506799.1 response regulator transcription factor [Paraclostridium bifermentans]